ncbi:MAG: MFS transporter [Actinomycetia bacterium]|nr:MFS transporter [Actinomycetes bacterium]
MTKLPGRYWRLWTAAAISNAGDGVFVIALPLLAARITNEPSSIALVATFFTIPWLLFSVPVGALIDRADRRRVLVIADLCRGALVGGLALVAAFDDVQLWMLWALAFGLGLGEVFFDNGSQAILPSVVEEAQLERANGLLYSSEIAGSTFVGMPIGSTLFGIAVWLPFGIDAASFVVAAMLAASLRGSFRPTPRAATNGEGKVSLISEMRAGLNWLAHHHVLRNLTLGVALINLALAATQATFVLFAFEELHIAERWFGPLVAIIGAGSLVAGIVGGKVVSKVGRRFAMLVAGLAPVLTSLAIGLFPVAWWVIVMTTIQALTITIWSIVAVTMRQQLVPDHLFGRVNSAYRWISTGVMPIGAFIGGLTAQWFGLRAPYFAASALLLIAYAVVALRLSAAELTAADQVALAERNGVGPQ